MSRTLRRNHPATVYSYRRVHPRPRPKNDVTSEEWLRRMRDLFSQDRLPDGRATEVPGGKRFKTPYRRIERRRREQALRVGDELTAAAPEKRCLWKSAWY